MSVMTDVPETLSQILGYITAYGASINRLLCQGRIRTGVHALPPFNTSVALTYMVAHW